MAGPAGPGERSLNPHQREGRAAKGTAVCNAAQARPQRGREDRIRKETTREGPASCTGQPEQSTDREVRWLTGPVELRVFGSSGVFLWLHNGTIEWEHVKFMQE